METPDIILLPDAGQFIRILERLCLHPVYFKKTHREIDPAFSHGVQSLGLDSLTNKLD
jgi:hypothetical protein